MNWLDAVFLGVLGVTLVLGLVKGFVRQVVGLAAVVLGLILAAVYYRDLTPVISPVVKNLFVSHFLAFLAIFLSVVAVGTLVGFLLSKLMKGPLAALDHLAGGGFGLLKGIVICAVLVVALVSFGVARRAVAESRLAPAAFGVAEAIVRIVPRELRERFDGAVREVRKGGGGHGQEI